MAQKPRENKATEGREKVPERWSAQQKTEVVVRLLRGEDLVEVSREVQVSPPELEEWRRVFLETGQQGLRRRGRDPGERGFRACSADPDSRVHVTVNNNRGASVFLSLLSSVSAFTQI